MPLESRTPAMTPLGKCERRMDIPMSEALEERLIAMAALNGVPKAVYARRVLEKAMFGEFAIARMMAGDPELMNSMNIG